MGISEFVDELQKAYGNEVYLGARNVRRFSTGCYPLDIATGGGWVFGHFHLLVGSESSGKTTTAIRAAAQINRINRDTGKIDETYSNPCGVFYLDQEGAFDPSWAKKIGFDTSLKNNVVAGFTSGEQCADAVNAAICSGEFSLIIIDSLETFVPKAKISGDKASMEDPEVGGRARIVNRGYRLWIASQKEIANQFKETYWRLPTVLALNQYRYNIVSFKDPRVIPGGAAQLFYSSIIVSFNNAKIKDDSKEYGIGEFSGIIKKNKTFPPKKNFAFEMALKQLDFLNAGEIPNSDLIFNDIKDMELLKKEGNLYSFLGENYRIQGDLKERLRKDSQFLQKVWSYLLEKHNSQNA